MRALSTSFSDPSMEILRRIDTGSAPCRVRPGPSLRAKAFACFSFRTVSEIAHGSIDNPHTRALDDRVPHAQNPRRPCIVALESRRSGKGDQRVDEREFVMELADTGKVLT